MDVKVEYGLLIFCPLAEIFIKVPRLIDRRSASRGDKSHKTAFAYPTFISFVRRLVADQRANVYEIPGKGAFLPIEIEFTKRGSTCFCVIGQNETNRIERIGFRIGAEVPAFVLW